MREVTADDAMYFLARFQSGALGAFLCTRFATGRKNFLRLEIFGSEGSLMFNLERLNELEYYSRSEPGTEQGFRTILVTENQHPYVNAWWPPGMLSVGNTLSSMRWQICSVPSRKGGGYAPISKTAIAANWFWMRFQSHQIQENGLP